MKKVLPTSTTLSVNNSKGFTLVELLVVITIIAVLSAISIVTYTSVQKNARDAKRKEDVQAIQKALEAHYNDTSCGATLAPPLPYCRTDSNNAQILFASGSMPVYPPHPTSAGEIYVIVYKDNSGNIVSSTVAPGATYTVCARLENNTGNYDDSGAATPNTTNTGNHYCLKSQQ